MLKRLIPATNWLANYDKNNLGGDLSAGVIVAVMLIPQGMAYAMLAGLPPVIGLYAATIPLIVYALFGTSKHLAVGPVAMVSILVFAGVSPLAEPGSKEYISLVLLLMLMIGLLQFLMGVLRLGFLVNFLSHAVISAFTSAAAIIIGISQLEHLFGMSLEADHVFLTLVEIVKNISQINWIAFSIGGGSIILLIFLRKYIPRIPGPLAAVVGTILIVYFLNLQDYGIKIVGDVPKGLPGFSLPTFTIQTFIDLLPAALTISFIGFMESIAMAKAIAARETYEIHPNKELVGLGLANVVGSFFSAYPVTGGFSRSAVNYQAGARTPLASMITASLILLTLLFFTGLFYYLPQAVLAAIIIVAVYSLIDLEEVKYLFSIKKLDGWTWIITFVATLVIGIEQGIMIGVAFSLITFIGRSAYPHVAELGHLPQENVFRNIDRYPQAETVSDVLIFRVDSSLYFANMTFFENKLCEHIQSRKSIRSVVFDFSGVNSIDAIAIKDLEEIMRNCGQGKVKYVFSNIKGPVIDLLKKADWDDKFREDLTYKSVEEALDAVNS